MVQSFVKGEIPAYANVLFNIVGNNYPAITEYNLFLPFEKGNFIPKRVFMQPLAVLEFPCYKVPLLNPAQNIPVWHYAPFDAHNYWNHIVFGYPVHYYKGLPWNKDIYQWFLGTKSKTSCFFKDYIKISLLDASFETIIEYLCTPANPACAHPYCNVGLARNNLTGTVLFDF
ncbi:hypothetical protein SDC9_94783 [bioreactor metagenome]|uniref:Uncharacterized protein n=1 Tax=bioreactor metagenome TaxID=1076179 RepID=A0A645A6Z3_9ZZZZ